MVALFAHSGDPDQTPRSVASDLRLYCLPVTRLGVSSLQWVNSISSWYAKRSHAYKDPFSPDRDYILENKI